jgi:hypothetical protein
LIQQDTNSLQEVASVASNTLSTLEFNHIKALHDFVMVQFAEGESVNYEFFVGFKVSANNFVIVLSFGNSGVWAQKISNLVQLLLLLSYSVRSDLLLLGDLFIDCLRLGDFLVALVLTFAVLLLLGDNLRNSVFVFIQIVEGELR